MQNDEVLTSLCGRGVAVCEGAKKQCVADRQQLLADRLLAVLDEAIRSGLDEERLRTMFEKALKNAMRSGEKQS